jgi:hypothetical protein
MNEKKLPDAAAAKFVGTHPYYYRQYREARKIFFEQLIMEVGK